MRPIILYRGREFEDDELEAAIAAGFICTNSRLDVQPDDLVVPRYSALPFYPELEADVKRLGGRLINTHQQHRYIADMLNWYDDLRPYTAAIWPTTMDIPHAQHGPFVVKGCTNSKKFLWDTHMFAATRADIGTVIGRLQDDALIGAQSIYIRNFERYKTYKTGLHGLPVTKEFRFFVAYGQILSGGFYWSSHIDELLENDFPESEFDPDQVPRRFLQDIIDAVGNNADAFCVDTAEHEDGRWRVIELNDLSMSGLSQNKPEVLYPNLMKAIRNHVDITTQG